MEFSYVSTVVVSTGNKSGHFFGYDNVIRILLGHLVFILLLYDQQTLTPIGVGSS